MYLKEAYLLAKNNNPKWYKSLVNIMKNTDLDQMCDHLTIHPNLLITELKCLKNLFIQETVTINNRKIKIIKYDFIYEPYLELPYHLRNTLTLKPAHYF